MSRRVIFLALLLVPGCGWLWPRDNPLDPARCQPSCGAGQICFEGTCITADAGADARADASPDLGSDATLPDALADQGGDGPPACPAPGWSAMSSGTAENLEAVWGSSATDVFAVGEKGTILHHDGIAWSTMSSGTSGRLRAVMGTGPDNVFAAGDTGTLLRYDGSKWAAQGLVTDRDLHGIWAVGSDLFVVGSQGTLLHWDGTTWSTEQLGGTLVAVFGRSKSDVVVLGSSGWYRYDGTTWHLNAITGAESHKAIWGNAKTLFVVGTLWGGSATGLIARYEGSGLTVMPGGGTRPLAAVWGSSNGHGMNEPADVLAVGQGGAALYYDGSHWVEQPTGTLVDLTGIWRSDDNRAFAVGKLGTILHHRGSWVHLARKTTRRLQAVWGSGPNDVVAVGEDGTVLRFDGATWQASSAGFNTLDDVWGDGSGALFAVGREGNPQTGFVTRYSGSWSSIHASDRLLLGIWGVSATELFVAGPQRIERLATGVWLTEEVGTVLDDLWGSSATDVYAVGDKGSIHRFDGATWSADGTSGTTLRLHGIDGRSATDIFVVGASGTVLRGHQGAWSAMTSGVTAKLDAVWVGSTGAFAVGERGTIIHHDGSAWRSTVTGTSYTLHGIWGSSETDVYAVGEQGVLLHRCGP